MEKIKILFVNDEMQMGGVARVLNTLLKSLDPEKYEMDLLVLHPHGMLMKDIPDYVNLLESTPFFYPVDQSLTDLFALPKWGMLLNKLRLLFYMKSGLIKNKIRKNRKKLIKKHYDVEVAVKEGFCTIFTAYGDSDYKVNWVLTDYSACNFSKNHMHLLNQALSLIDMNVADSRGALDAYAKVFTINDGCVLHNLMDFSKVINGLNQDNQLIELNKGLNICAVARFHPQKSLDRLLAASLYCHEKGINHHVYLIGDGIMEEQLRSFVKEHNMTYVTFLGVMANPYPIVKHCDLYVLSSKFEGFATIVNESFICGTPVLSTHVSGIVEQIDNPDYGWIVENNQQALNLGLYRALSKPKRLKEMKVALNNYTYPNEYNLQQFERLFHGELKK